jgi:hypothetical protein
MSDGNPREGEDLAPPSVDLGRLREVRLRDLGLRFLAGALTSLVAGLVTLGFGPRAGGLLLAFPAILGASLTLIEEQEDSAEAREDARGAVLGGGALAVFAAVCAVSFRHLPGGVVLGIAALGWAAVALGGYALLSARRRSA